VSRRLDLLQPRRDVSRQHSGGARATCAFILHVALMLSSDDPASAAPSRIFC
jgi:hypothetical protein